MTKPMISADSHVTEHPDCYITRVAQKYRDRVPHMVFDAKMGDMIVMEGVRPVILSLASAAGEDPEQLLTKRGDEARFEVLPKGGWETESRLQAQDEDGVAAEVLAQLLSHRLALRCEDLPHGERRRHVGVVEMPLHGFLNDPR